MAATVQEKTYGSQSLDEMRTRMREAGYQDWEIEEELEEMESVRKTLQANTAKYAAENIGTMDERIARQHRDKIEVVYKDDLELSQEQVDECLDYALKNYPGASKVTLAVDEDNYLTMAVGEEPEPFERIRRITGYLVGTMDRWNNAKTAEEHDRVKHSTKRPSPNECAKNAQTAADAQTLNMPDAKAHEALR